MTATEIAELNLPGLPRSKPGLISRAKAEGWYSEERKGRGGTALVWLVPERYLNQEGGPSLPTIAAGSRVDPELVTMAVKALENWADQNNVIVDPTRKGAIVALLYDYLARGAQPNELDTVFRALKQ